VNQHERGDQPAESSIRELQIMADEGTEGDNDLAIDVVKEIDRGKD
jgi:hypothetical protein